MTSAPVLLIQIDGLERPLVAGEPLGQMPVFRVRPPCVVNDTRAGANPFQDHNSREPD
jgi:hypothetical protein